MTANRPRTNAPSRLRLRAIFGTALALSILTIASGCDKHEDAPEKTQTSLAGKPRALLLMFGDRTEPRVLPLAMLTNGRVEPIHFDSTGWRNFDRLYFTAGAQLTAYQSGVPIGTATVKRGMWDGSSLYKLPACRSLRPMATVSMSAPVEGAVMMEILATTDPLNSTAVRTPPAKADHDSAVAFAVRAAQREGLTSSARADLDEVIHVLPTGATAHPTFVAAYMEKGSGLTGKPRHVFVLGDYVDAQRAYVTSFVHVPGHSAREFRRYIDHLDLTGDGVDEIVLEGWRKEGDSFLVILRYQNGHWREVMRTPSSWCDDGRRS